MLNMLTNIL